MKVCLVDIHVPYCDCLIYHAAIVWLSSLKFSAHAYATDHGQNATEIKCNIFSREDSDTDGLKKNLYFRRPPEAWGPWHFILRPRDALNWTMTAWPRLAKSTTNLQRCHSWVFFTRSVFFRCHLDFWVFLSVIWVFSIFTWQNVFSA